MYNSNEGSLRETNINWPTNTAVALERAVSKLGSEAFHKDEELIKELRSSGIEKPKIKQIELALSCDSVSKYFKSMGDLLTQTEINNIILELRRSGFDSDTARILTAELLYSLHIPQISLEPFITTDDSSEDAVPSDLYVPQYVYKPKMEEYLNKIRQHEEFDTDQLYELKQFADADIPEASYIMGCVYNMGLGVEPDSFIAQRYIHRAAEQGYPLAYALLGDAAYNMNMYDLAYEYYSMPGAVALNSNRIQTMKKLMEAKKYSQKVCFNVVLLFFVTIAFIVLAAIISPPSLLHTIFGCICGTISIFILGFVIFEHNKFPFKDLRQFGVFFAFVVFLYSIIVLL